MITIIRFANYAAINALFNEALKEKTTVSLWRQRSFQKACNVRDEDWSGCARGYLLWRCLLICPPLAPHLQIGNAKATWDRVDVHYNKSKMQVEIHGSCTLVEESYMG